LCVVAGGRIERSRYDRPLALPCRHGSAAGVFTLRAA
jgi:hypothetical protein